MSAGISFKQLHPFRRLMERINHAMDSAKINSIVEARREGRAWIVKRRNAPGRQISAIANFYFGLAHIPIRYWSHLGDWQRWEIDCFRMLNRDRFDARADGADTVWLAKIPGTNLWEHLQRQTITRRMLRAAGDELCRAHRFWSEEFQGPWSHGDASMSNFIYDEKAQRARLVDFEIVHEKCISAPVRHADDLLVFLLDLAGFASQRRWLPLALAFLETYDRRSAIVELHRRLHVPTGIARIWWNVRTNFVGAGRIGRRLQELRRAIETRGLLLGNQAVVASRARQARRVSMNRKAMNYRAIPLFQDARALPA